MREALLAQAIGDLDGVLNRVEGITATVKEAEQRAHATAAAIDRAGDGYRMAVTAFTESAKADLTEYAKRKAKQLADATLEDLEASMQAAAATAFRSEASDKAAQLGIALSHAAKDFRRSNLSRFLEHGLTALVSSLLTSGAVLLALRLHA